MPLGYLSLRQHIEFAKHLFEWLYTFPKEAVVLPLRPFVRMEQIVGMRDPQGGFRVDECRATVVPFQRPPAIYQVSGRTVAAEDEPAQHRVQHRVPQQILQFAGGEPISPTHRLLQRVPHSRRLILDLPATLQQRRYLWILFYRRRY
jgi:hypothetical protein